MIGKRILQGRNPQKRKWATRQIRSTRLCYYGCFFSPFGQMPCVRYFCKARTKQPVYPSAKLQAEMKKRKRTWSFFQSLRLDISFVIWPPHLLYALLENYIVAFSYYPSHKFIGQLWSSSYNTVSVPVIQGLSSTNLLFGLFLPGTVYSVPLQGKLYLEHMVSQQLHHKQIFRFITVLIRVIAH